MKTVELPNRGIEVGGVAQTTKFTIAANGKIIKNVISSIYSAKEKTVVRELMANALDAHAAAGKEDCPIEVHIPAVLDSTFVVRDFGVGMDHDFVMSHYSAIGFSTKETTNSQTGMFGVGSKSPLAICDTFTVRCFDKPGWNGDQPYVVRGADLNTTGRIRLYTVAITDDDVPQISHTFDVVPKASDRVEEGGVEIKVPISDTSRSKIIDGVSSQHFCWFDRPVKFFGSVEEVERNTYKQIFKIADRLYIGLSKQAPSTLAYGAPKVFVRQGAAVYPVDLSSGPLYYKISPLATRVTSALSSGNRRLMLDVPIGTVDVTMAREGIQYNDASIKNLVDAYEEAVAAYSSALESHIGDARTVPAALDKLCEKYLTEEQKPTLSVLKDASELIPLVVNRIEKNHIAWRESLLDAAVEESDADDRVDTITFRGVKPTLYLRDFPEGKVILHNWRLYGEHSPVISAQGPKQAVSISYPYIAVIIPSHLEKWPERTAAFLKSKFADESFSSSSSDAVDVLIVRCAKRNIQGVKDALSRIAPFYACFTSSDFPGVESFVRTPSTRTFSKTSVYKWNFSRGDFEENKVEPNYEAPAYYCVRRGITNDVFGAHPDVSHASSKKLAQFIGPTRLYNMMREAHNYGLMAQNVPIYRVTEKQAKLIAERAPAWKYLPYALLDVIERDGNVLTSALDYMIDNRGELYQYLRNFFSWTKYSVDDAQAAAGIQAFRQVMKADPLFETLAALAYCASNRGEPNIEGDAPKLSRLRRAVVYEYSDDALCEVSAALEQSVEILEKRHEVFLYLLQRDKMISSPSVGLYLNAYLPTIRDKAVATDLSGFTYANAAIKKLHEMLDYKIAACNSKSDPVSPCVTEETEEEAKYA